MSTVFSTCTSSESRIISTDGFCRSNGKTGQCSTQDDDCPAQGHCSRISDHCDAGCPTQLRIGDLETRQRGSTASCPSELERISGTCGRSCHRIRRLDTQCRDVSRDGTVFSCAQFSRCSLRFSAKLSSDCIQHTSIKHPSQYPSLQPPQPRSFPVQPH
jgi:hypothetical protein